MISKTIGFRGLAYFQTYPYTNFVTFFVQNFMAEVQHWGTGNVGPSLRFEPDQAQLPIHGFFNIWGGENMWKPWSKDVKNVQTPRFSCCFSLLGDSDDCLVSSVAK